MSLTQLRNVNFGAAKTGAPVQYRVLDASGVEILPPTTTGVYESIAGSGIYAAPITFSNNFSGSIVWDTNDAAIEYATEQYNYQENNPNVDNTLTMLTAVSGSIDLVRDMTEGKWKIVSNKMQFYKADNTTLIAEFNLFDNTGAPSMDAVFERRRI
jgi:hypothetical protein